MTFFRDMRMLGCSSMTRTTKLSMYCSSSAIFLSLSRSCFSCFTTRAMSSSRVSIEYGPFSLLTFTYDGMPMKQNVKWISIHSGDFISEVQNLNSGRSLRVSDNVENRTLRLAATEPTTPQNQVLRTRA